MIITAMKRIRSRPGLRGKPPSESTMNTTETTGPTEKSESFSSLNANNSNHHSAHGKSRVVCFAMDYQSPPHEELAADPTPLSEEELQGSFYSSTDLQRFDKDRALTVLMYETRNNQGSSNSAAAWDDNLYSIRGLEEYIGHPHTSSASTASPCRIPKVLLLGAPAADEGKSGSDRRRHRQALQQAVLQEQVRLHSDAGRAEVATAAAALHTGTDDLVSELLRGVSCGLSKADKQRALLLGQKDEKEVKGGGTGRRRYLAMVKGKINDWANTSNKSVGSAHAPPTGESR